MLADPRHWTITRESFAALASWLESRGGRTVCLCALMCPPNKRVELNAPPSRFPGRVLLSHDAIAHSTIGAEGLNCRVRNGNGCFTFAMATGNFIPSASPHGTQMIDN